jgi:hypothetical protein
MMKIFFFLLIFLPFFSLAQECKLTREKDPFTKEIKVSTGFTYFDGGSVNIDADSKEINFLFNIEGKDRCFDDMTTVEFYFEGLKGKTSSRNGGTMNCEGLFQLVYKNSNSNPTTLLQRLLTRKITQAIFMVEGKKPLTVTFSPKDQDNFMALANCLYNEAKTLIK